MQMVSHCTEDHKQTVKYWNSIFPLFWHFHIVKSQKTSNKATQTNMEDSECDTEKANSEKVKDSDSQAKSSQLKEKPLPSHGRGLGMKSLTQKREPFSANSAVDRSPQQTKNTPTNFRVLPCPI